MGWKSGRTISRDAAIDTLIKAKYRKLFERLTNDELENMLSEEGVGDDDDLDFYGYNLTVTDDGVDPR